MPNIGKMLIFLKQNEEHFYFKYSELNLKIQREVYISTYRSFQKSTNCDLILYYYRKFYGFLKPDK